MTFEFYCQLIDSVIKTDCPLSDVDCPEIMTRVRTLFQANKERQTPKDHVEVFSEVCSELLSEVSLARLFVGLNFAIKYLALLDDLNEDELAGLRLQFSDELKFIIKGNLSDNRDHKGNLKELLTRLRWSRVPQPMWTIMGVVLACFLYQQLALFF